MATYYFRHESGDSECETSSDEGMGRSTAALNYSREDIQALATQAELMVLGRIENRREMEIAVDGDSDYSSNHPLSPLVSSEPNLQRRTSPKRRVLNSRRRDWRNSLPECLEFYHHGGQHNRGSDQRSLQHSVSTGGERASSSSPQKHLQPSSARKSQIRRTAVLLLRRDSRRPSSLSCGRRSSANLRISPGVTKEESKTCQDF